MASLFLFLLLLESFFPKSLEIDFGSGNYSIETLFYRYSVALYSCLKANPIQQNRPGLYYYGIQKGRGLCGSPFVLSLY